MNDETQHLKACIRALTKQCASLIQEREELQKKVWSYEKQGATCQTLGHGVDSRAECNTHGEAA